MSRASILRSPWLWFALLLLGAEAVALAWVQRQPVELDGYRRNATPLRNWPAYTACRRDGDRPLAVLIGNSQAVGPEFADSNDIYVAMLQDRLAADGLDVDLRNWSVNGLRTNQLELLSLKALRCGASSLIFVLSLPNITEMHDYRLVNHAADVDRLAGEPMLWPYLHGSLVAELASPNDFIMATMRRHVALLSAREHLLDRTASTLDRRAFHALTGHLRRPNSRLTLAERAERAEQDGNGRINLGFEFGSPVHADLWRRQIERERMPVFERVYANLDRRLERHDARLTWVWSATRAEGHELDLVEVADAFQRSICQRLTDDGRPCHDLTRAMPRESFFDVGLGSHFNRDGQRRFADLVYPIVRDALH